MGNITNKKINISATIEKEIKNQCVVKCSNVSQKGTGKSANSGSLSYNQSCLVGTKCSIIAAICTSANIITNSVLTGKSRKIVFGFTPSTSLKQNKANITTFLEKQCKIKLSKIYGNTVYLVNTGNNGDIGYNSKTSPNFQCYITNLVNGVNDFL